MSDVGHVLGFDHLPDPSPKKGNWSCGNGEMQFDPTNTTK
jgi:hypothetical protein